MSNHNLTEQQEVATQQFKANSPIETQIKIVRGWSERLKRINGASVDLY